MVFKDIDIIKLKMGKVNLDALIPREDFEITDASTQGSLRNTSQITLSQLEAKDNFVYPILRKPDFQRETNEWDPNKVVKLIQNYVNGDLIPAIILWNSKGSNTFVIDGAHRLSALIAWVNDDYGDGVISRGFFENILDEQKEMAEKTRKLVESKIRPYSAYKAALQESKNLDQNFLETARELGRITLQLQWVNGDARKAEDSFFTINQEAVPIHPTELILLKNRNKPNGIAARAIKNSGTGHKYWSNFSKEKQEEIEKIAKETHDLIYIPRLKQPINSLELPIAGKPDSFYASSLVLNFVNIANGLVEKATPIQDDSDGSSTFEYLETCRKIALRINSKDSSSIGLHPAIYLYSKDGNYKVVSFYAMIDLILNFNSDKSLLDNFIKVRAQFEDLLSTHDYLISQIIRKHRSGNKSYPYIKEFYVEIIKKLSDGKPKESVIDELLSGDQFNYLKTDTAMNVSDDKKEFSVSAKSAIVIKECLNKSLKCKICGGLIDSKSITIDHITRKRNGGLGTIDNGQIAHPYCNTTVKN